MAAQNSTIKTTYVKAKIDTKQQNSKGRCGNSGNYLVIQLLGS